MPRRPWVKSVAWLLGGFLIAYTYVFISTTSTASENLDQCKAMVSSVSSRNRIPLSVSEPGSPAMFCDLGVHLPLLRSYFTVYIYGVLNGSEQDAILAEIRRFHDTSRTQKILVQFFAKENWKTWSDPASGRSGGSRGTESAIRGVWIK